MEVTTNEGTLVVSGLLWGESFLDNPNDFQLMANAVVCAPHESYVPELSRNLSIRAVIKGSKFDEVSTNVAIPPCFRVVLDT